MIRKVYEPNNAEYREEAIERLRTLFPIGSTATTMIRHVARSGMSRSISVLALKDGRIADVSYDVARVLGWSLDGTNGGIRVQGTGMNMSFHLIYSLSRVLWADSFVGSDVGSAGYAISNRSI